MNDADPDRKEVGMQIGIRAILLVIAIIFFIVALVSDSNFTDFLVLGLIFLAGAHLVEDLNLPGVGGPRGGGVTRT